MLHDFPSFEQSTMRLAEFPTHWDCVTAVIATYLLLLVLGFSHLQDEE